MVNFSDFIVEYFMFIEIEFFHSLIGLRLFHREDSLNTEVYLTKINY